ncbi:hypothetical protein IAU60_002423 [Kwoniella sp. DSM 27419]
MPPRLPIVIPRVAPQPASSAAAHLLSLVQNGHLDAAARVALSSLRRAQIGAGPSGSRSIASASTSASPQPGPSTYERRAVTPPRPRHQSRSHSTAAAVAEHDDHHAGPSYQDLQSHPVQAFAEPQIKRPSRRSLQARLPSTAITADKRFFRCLHPPDDWADLPPAFHSRLKKGAFQSAAHFAHDFDMNAFQARQIGSVGHLFRIFALFKETAEYDDWRWLAGKLEECTAFLSEEGVEIKQKAVPAVITAVRAFALASMGEEPEARALLDSETITDVTGQYNQPMTHAIAALALVKLDLWDEATKQMAAAINKGVLRIASTDHQEMDYPSYDYDLLKEYEQIVLDAGRPSDMMDVFRLISRNTRHFLVNTTKDGHAYPATISKVLFDALARLSDPLQWWLTEYEADTTDRRRLTASFGSLIFLAITRNRSRLPEALELFDLLLEKGVTLPSSSVIALCSKLLLESKEEAWIVYQRVRKSGIPLSHHARYRALQLASRAGWKEEEQKMWQEICETSKPTWKDRTTGAVAHARFGRVQETMASLEARVGPDYQEHPGALEILFTAYINANDAGNAYAVLQKINTIAPRLYPYNALLQLYADQGNVPAAVQLFDELITSPLKPTQHSYTALISLFAHRRDPMNADNCFRAMIEAGLEPDKIAYGAIINAEVESGEWLAAAKRWSKLPPEIKTHRSIASAIVRALVMLSSPTEHVLALFRQISKPSDRTWALVIQSACDSGDMDLARDLFEEMEHVSRETNGTSEPITYTMSILLHGYMQHGDGASARAVYDEMVKREVIPSSVTYGMIVKSFADARGDRSLEQAHDFAITVYKQAQGGYIADRRHQKALVNQNIFSPLVVAHGRAQNWEMAQEYHDMIGDDRSKESVHMYAQIMDVHRRAGNVEKVLENWNKAFSIACDVASFRPPSKEVDPAAAERPMRSNDNILCIPLSIALDSLSTVGKYHDVKRIWNDVESAGFGFDAANYNHLCVALARTGDVMGAFMVADQILLKRYEEVKQRKNEAVRESASFLSLQEIGRRNNSLDVNDMEQIIASDAEEDAISLDVVDRPVQPFYGPPNRRSAMHQRSPFTPEAKADPTAQLNLRLLQSWRPSDVLWKPSLLTLSVLDTAYAQLEEASRRRAWVPLTLSDEAENEDDSGAIEGSDAKPNKRTFGVVLPLFGNMPVRNHMTGQPSRKGPTEILRSLNKRYSRIVGLIMFHRKKRVGVRGKQDKPRQKK